MAGARGGVVAPQLHAVEVGIDVLSAGGNAVDASVAAALVQGVVDPIMCGPGGYGVLLRWSPETREGTVIDGSARVGSLAREEQWTPIALGPTEDRFGYRVEGNINEIGYQSIAVPGLIDALAEAHSRWGRTPWAELLEPATRLAADGFIVTEATTDFWRRPATEGRTSGPDRITYTSAARAIFAPQGRPLQPGERLIQTAHADVLRQLAREGPRAFYEGDVATTMAADIQANGGFVTRQDLHAYRAEAVKCWTGAYRGRGIFTAPPPFGGSLVTRMLGVLESHELDDLDHDSAEYLDLVARAMRAGTSARTIENLPAGTEHPDTTQLCVVDGDGNAVSLTHSLGYSSGVVTGSLGFLYNNYMNCFNPLPGRPDSVGPGRQRESSMAPTVVASTDQATHIIGSPGATRIPGAIVQVLANSIDFGMSAVEAVSAPRVDTQGAAGAVHVEGRISSAATSGLERMNVTVIRHTANYDRYFGRPQLLAATRAGWEGASDPRGDGAAAMFID